VVYTCRTKNRDHNKTYGTKTLNKNLGIKVDKTCGVSSLESVNAYACKLEKHSLLKVKIVYYEISRSLTSDKKVGSEPTGKRVSVAVRDKTKHALLVAKVGVSGLVTTYEALTATDNRGNDLVTYLDRLTCGIGLHVFTKSDDLAGTLMTESYRNKSEGVALPLVDVGAANAAALDLDENVVVLKCGNRKFLYFYFLCRRKHSDLRLARNILCDRRACRHFGNELTNYAFYLCSVQFHLRFLSYIMRKLSDITQRRSLVKLFAEVIPSPVGPAMVKVACPSPPKPMPA
jgi:hypothetical protein